jgi:hypothetical protein
MSAKIALTALIVTTVFAASTASSLAGKDDMGGKDDTGSGKGTLREKAADVTTLSLRRVSIRARSGVVLPLRPVQRAVQR